MGGNQSSTSSASTAVTIMESEESKKYKELLKADKQLTDLKAEVHVLEPLIKEGIRVSICEEEDVVVATYKDLTDKNKIVQNINDLFVDFPHKEFLVETAKTLIEVMSSTEEMSTMMRWQSRKKMQKMDDKVYGLEIQYKVKVYEESKKEHFYSMNPQTQTVLLLAYKCMAHVMEKSGSDIPTAEELKKLKL